MSSTAAITKVTQLTVRVENGPARGQAHQLQKSPIYIGRDADNDIVVAQDSKMSRRHVEIAFDGHGWNVKNLSQKNRIRINGSEVQQATISGMTKIEVGDTELMLSIPSGPSNLSMVGAARPPSSASSPAAPVRKAAAMGQVGVAPQRTIRQAPPQASSEDKKTKKIRLFLVIGIVLIGALYFVSKPGAVGTKKGVERVFDKAILDLEKSREVTQEIQKNKLSPQEKIRFDLAQEQYIKGFRDYRQGQYARAMVAFNAALGLYPTHELARKYYDLAKRKFYEVVQAMMVQGKRYRGVNNYRMCKSSFAGVMVMIKDSSDPVYVDAKQYFDECTLKMGDKF
jgi:hypothetical protein